jgi:LCP family protein required for cell wall assembly
MPVTGVIIASVQQMNVRFSVFLVVLSTLIAGCFPSNSGTAYALAGTPTATPFLPTFVNSSVGDQQVSDEEPAGNSSQASLYVANFPPATSVSDIAVPNPVGRLPQPEGQLNILLLGSDKRPDDGGFRTDVILLLTLNPEGGSVSLTSFPRDLYVFVPGWRADRINSAFARGGFQMMQDTMEYNFGVRPDHYVLVNFDGFKNIINELGGVNVQVAEPLYDERDGPGDFGVPAGEVAMDGETALWYVRSRGTSSDFDRTRREQEVLEALFWRILSSDGLSKAPELYEHFKNTVTTDISIEHILPMLPLAVDIAETNNIHRYAIGPEQVNSYTTSGGGAVLLPVYDVIISIMQQALNSSS